MPSDYPHFFTQNFSGLEFEMLVGFPESVSFIQIENVNATEFEIKDRLGIMRSFKPGDFWESKGTLLLYLQIFLKGNGMIVGEYWT